MKKLTGLVIILAAVVLGAYYGMGLITERTVKHNLAMVNQTNGVKASVTDYQRGWFKSHAELQWVLHIPERTLQNADGQTQIIPAQDIELQMPMDIFHGPFIFAHGLKFGMGYAESGIAMPKAFVEQFNNTFTTDSTQPELRLNLMVNYLNASRLMVSVPEFKLVDKKDKSEFDWLGMSSSFHLNASMDTMRGQVTVDGLNFAKEGMSASLGEVVSNYDFYRADNGLILGRFDMALPSFVIKNQNATLFAVTSFGLQSNNDVSNGLFSASVNSSLEKIDAQGKTYGPAEFSVALRNLDADALARINAHANAAQNGNPMQKQKAMLAIMPELPKLLSRGAAFEISKFSFKLPEGTLLGHLKVNLPELKSANPIEMMQKVHGQGQLTIPEDVLKLAVTETLEQNTATQSPQTMSLAPAANQSLPVAQQVEQRIAAMVQSGLIVKQGNDYIIAVTLDNGQVMVNGKPYHQDMVKF